MSDDYIVVIAEKPDFVPSESRLRNAVAYFRSLSPSADEVSTAVSDHIKFVDCGANFGIICCPCCDTEVELSLWQEWMGHDFDGNGFVLTEHPVPCCGAKHTLQELNYEWPQGFARFQVSAMNPNLDKLLEDQERRFEEILGCQVRVIYRHC